MCLPGAMLRRQSYGASATTSGCPSWRGNAPSPKLWSIGDHIGLPVVARQRSVTKAMERRRPHRVARRGAATPRQALLV